MSAGTERRTPARSQAPSGNGRAPTPPRKRWLTRGRQVWVLTVLLGLVAAMAADGLEYLDRYFGRNWAEIASRNAYDVALYYRRDEAKGLVKDPRIVIVQIDDATLKEFGVRSTAQLPRSLYALLLDRLRAYGVRAVAFDIVFTPETPDDPALVQALERMKGRAVVGAEFQERIEEISSKEAGDILKAPTHTVPDLRYAAGNWGWVNVPQDMDNTVRRFQWYEPGLNDDAEERKMPTLAVAAAALYLGRNPVEAVQEVDAGRFCGRRVEALEGAGATASRPTSLIEFWPRVLTSGFKTFAFQDIVASAERAREGRRDFEELRDRLVFVGDVSGVSQDMHKVPGMGDYQDAQQAGATLPGARHQKGGKRPGLHIQASIAHTILSGHYSRTATPETEAAFLLFVCLGTALVTRRLNPMPGLGTSVITVLVIWFGSILAEVQWAYWLDPVRASGGVVLAYMFEMALLQLTERRQQRELKEAFGGAVGPAVMNDILREDEAPELGGELREVTLLFSDLQGFTTISERMEAPQLVSILNDYFGVMLAIIDRHGGVLDKLMGDGIMAYFGAPVAQPDHAARALDCAIEMQLAMLEFRRDPKYRDMPSFYMRIGLHTGEAVVGLIGAERRYNYSVIGDVVNVAARLEGLNKEFGTTIMMSEETCQAAKAELLTKFHGEASVKGRMEPLKVYSVGPKLEE